MPKSRQWLIRTITPLLIAGALIVPGATPAGADPGHCWRAGAGPISNVPNGYLYQIKNICSSAIKIKIVFSDGSKGSCLSISGLYHRWYASRRVYSYWSGVNC
ncbi:hypothetical protein ACFFX1_19075 [Dactylosporangium sucinum]|uniref:Uncharacterized protein n=1 Tax=Dactylosporangium sucinum TaxID=1424081 RepID=A0A917X0F9_9ACTN|nr:hypothetical protein [Dactylosporangium sucinum]GGM47180.1 hypothetical protein GCM10007977_056030 [Dactylosporangium sucinum]